MKMISKKENILRQAINVSPEELRNLANELQSEGEETLKDIYNNNKDQNQYNEQIINKQKFLVSIINKQPKCSDTWEFEK